MFTSLNGLSGRCIALPFILLVSVFIHRVNGQVNVRDSVVTGTLFNVHLGYQVPGLDMADRFGNNLAAGGSVLFKLRKNWLLGAEGHFLFGQQVKEDTLFKGILHTGGIFFGTQGLPANVTLMQRGYSLYGKAGKVISFGPFNPNSGLMLLGGVGFLQHKIRIQVNQDLNGNNLPQLTKTMKKGYDRLSNGLAANQFIGFVHFDKRRLVNFFIGFEFTHAWTKNRRSWNYDTNSEDTAIRNDLFYGIKLGWILPVYNSGTDHVYYY